MRPNVRALLSCCTWTVVLAFASIVEAGDAQSESKAPRIFPRRTVEEAAVLEWGNSAIITALDASVALFGPQTSDAALLEVETAPVLAVPLDGLSATLKQDYQDFVKGQKMDNKTSVESDAAAEEAAATTFSVPIQPLENADEIAGNLCIMTTHPGVSGVELALMAQESGAAAVLVVNVNDPQRPDDIYRLPATQALTGELDPRADQVDIPVVMISLNSAQMLATALLDPEAPESHDLARKAGFSATYMPQRVRLYAGDDRPFFEDVEASQPTIYLIHDLLKDAECDLLIQQAERAGLTPVTHTDWLQYTAVPPAPSSPAHVNVDRVTLWQGLWMTAAAKQIEERMEQVTSFPVAHYSDFVIDRLRTDGSSQISPLYDILAPEGASQAKGVPVASMTIFLSDLPAGSTGGEVLYPSVIGAENKRKRRQTTAAPIQIEPRKGMAVIHHSTDERGQLDASALHALLPITGGSDEYFYVAHKYIFMDAQSTARRTVLPLLAMPSRGKLPPTLVNVHQWFVDQFGFDQGTTYFDKVCVFVPILLVAMVVQWAVDRVRSHWASKSSSSSASSSSSSANKQSDQKKASDASAAPAPKRKKRTKRE